MESKPVRLQLSRKSGFRLVSPNGLPITVVSRPSKWGNPFDGSDYENHDMSKDDLKMVRRLLARKRFATALATGVGLPYNIDDVVRELRGRNLACWCPLSDPCHADVLLRVANGLLFTNKKGKNV
jgi:hypothetical protein